MKKTEKDKRSHAHANPGFFTAGVICFLLAGCGGLRFAPNETQKQNAWLHNRTAIVAAETARAEDASETLQALTQLNEVQSRAFSSYYGLPKEFPQAETAADILSESNCGHGCASQCRATGYVAGGRLDAGAWDRNLCGSWRCRWCQSGAIPERCPNKIAGPAGSYHRQRAVQKAEPGSSRRFQASPQQPVARNPPTRRSDENINS